MVVYESDYSVKTAVYGSVFMALVAKVLLDGALLIVCNMQSMVYELIDALVL